MQIPPTQRNINSKESTPRTGFTATIEQLVRWEETWKGGGRGNKTQKVLTGMPSLVKAAERQRERREVSVMPRDTGQRTLDGSEGHPNSDSFQTRSRQRRVMLQDQPKRSPESHEGDQDVPLGACWGGKAHAKRPPSRAAGGARQPSEPAGTQLRRSKRTPDNTDNAKRGWARQ